MSGKLTVGSLFSGIGGIDLGLERAGMETRWFSEIDPYASRVLAKHWPAVPNHGDITQIDWSNVERTDVLAGGFPCQDISIAGSGAGLEGEHSGLWTHFAAAIRHLRPAYVLVENSPVLPVRGLGNLLGDLARLGYDAEWDCIPAAAVGARHLRARTWLVAYPSGVGNRLATETIQPRGEITFDGSWWTAEPGLVRVADGIPARVDRLRGLGNAVVPQIPELIGGWIIEHAHATGYLERAA